MMDYEADSPTGIRKLFYFSWPLILLLCTIAAAGFLMLYSVAGGNFETWARPQLTRFLVGVGVMFCVGFTPLRWWQWLTPLIYVAAIGGLVAVELVGERHMGAQRWLNLGGLQIQPSEVMKIGLVMALALYYHRLDPNKVSRPQWLVLPIILIIVPMMLVVRQPDLGTALLIGIGGVSVMFFAGVSLWYFMISIGGGAGLIYAVLISRGTNWQLLKDYQYRRIDTFLDPSLDPLGDGYHITQSKIALGSGGISGRGFMQGTQSRLNFLPEKHTDFIFTSLAEEFGFAGGVFLLLAYVLVLIFCFVSMIMNRDRFGALMTGGITITFFLLFAVNMAMVMGMAPVVGVPLPLISYGGSAMLVLMGAFGLIQSAHIHRPRRDI